MKGRPLRGGVRSIGHEHDFCQAEKAENTDPRRNYAVKYATARGHLVRKGPLGRHRAIDPVRKTFLNEFQKIPQ